MKGGLGGLRAAVRGQINVCAAEKQRVRKAGVTILENEINDLEEKHRYNPTFQNTQKLLTARGKLQAFHTNKAELSVLHLKRRSFVMRDKVGILLARTL